MDLIYRHETELPPANSSRAYPLSSSSKLLGASSTYVDYAPSCPITLGRRGVDPVNSIIPILANRTEAQTEEASSIII